MDMGSPYPAPIANDPAGRKGGPYPRAGAGRRRRGSTLDACLQLPQGRPHDATLGPPLHESGQRDLEVDDQPIGDLGGAVT